jgi:hypothetical protein
MSMLEGGPLSELEDGLLSVLEGGLELGEMQVKVRELLRRWQEAVLSVSRMNLHGFKGS